MARGANSLPLRPPPPPPPLDESMTHHNHTICSPHNYTMFSPHHTYTHKHCSIHTHIHTQTLFNPHTNTVQSTHTHTHTKICSPHKHTVQSSSHTRAPIHTLFSPHQWWIHGVGMNSHPPPPPPDYQLEMHESIKLWMKSVELPFSCVFFLFARAYFFGPGPKFWSRTKNRSRRTKKSTGD